MRRYSRQGQPQQRIENGLTQWRRWDVFGIRTANPHRSFGMNWNIPRLSGEPLDLSLEANDRVFVVGANGSGKSALIQRFVSEHQGTGVRRISAHRQTWLDSGSLTLTPLGRKQFEQNNSSNERNDTARWRDSNSQQKQSAVLFDLVARENTRARSIARLVDDQ